MKKLIILIPVIFIFCGCRDYKELNDIAIVSGMSIDKKKDKYKISILVANSKNSDGSQKEGVAGTAVYTTKSKSIANAIKDLDNILPKKIYLGHLGIVILSDQVAKDGIDNITDYFFRNPETTKGFYIIMTEENELAENALKIISPLESFPFQNIKLSIENSSSSGAVTDNLTYSEFLEKYLKKGSEAYIPTIKIVGNVKKGSSTKTLESTKVKTYVDTKGLALFKSNKLVGYTKKNESRGINLVLNNAEEIVIKNNCKEGYIATIVNRIKAKRKVKFVNNKPFFYITITGNGDIEETNCNIDLKNDNDIKKIEKKINNSIKKLVNKGIKKSKEYKTDVFEFGNLVYKKNPKFYKHIDDWNSYFKNVKTNVKVNIKIRNKGSIKQSITKEKYDE